MRALSSFVGVMTGVLVLAVLAMLIGVVWGGPLRALGEHRAELVILLIVYVGALERARAEHRAAGLLEKFERGSGD